MIFASMSSINIARLFDIYDVRPPFLGEVHAIPPSRFVPSSVYRWWDHRTMPLVSPAIIHLAGLALVLQCTVCTWSWHQTSGGHGCHCISCGSNWNIHRRKWNLCRRPWDTRHRGLCQTSEAHGAPTQISGPWFCPCWPEIPSFLTSSLEIHFSWVSVMGTRSSA